MTPSAVLGYLLLLVPLTASYTPDEEAGCSPRKGACRLVECSTRRQDVSAHNEDRRPLRDLQESQPHSGDLTGRLHEYAADEEEEEPSEVAMRRGRLRTYLGRRRMTQEWPRSRKGGPQSPSRLVLRLVRPPARRPVVFVRGRRTRRPVPITRRRKRRPLRQHYPHSYRGWKGSVKHRQKGGYNKERQRFNHQHHQESAPSKKKGFKKPYYAYGGGEDVHQDPDEEEDDEEAEESTDIRTRYPTNSIAGQHYDTRRISQIKCEEYGSVATETIAELSKYGVVPVRVEKCSLTNVKYSSGTAAGIAEFPHMAGVGYNDNGNAVWGCSGSLISENFVLTAAHCAYSPMGMPEWVELGDTHLDDGNLDRGGIGGGWQEAGVAQVIVHPLYNSTTRHYDAALLRLDTEITFTDQVRPACLALTTVSDPVRSALATDWTPFEIATMDIKLGPNKTHSFSGASGSGGVSLRKAKVNILDGKECSDVSGVPEETSIICADPMQSCSSQGGGPLQVRNEANKCMYDIIGVSSFQDCERKTPAIYSKIEQLLTWIENTVWP